MTMTKRVNYGDRYLIHARVAEAKRRMDDAIAALEKAEDEWHQACIECDRVDGDPDEGLPTADDVRGILKPTE